MSHSYTFEKSGVLKPYALDSQARAQFTSFQGLNYGDPTLVLQFDSPLSPETLASVTQFVNNYTDPEVFLQLNSTITDSTMSKPTSSLTPQIIQTFIWPVTSSEGSGVFNAFKSVLEYSCPDISVFANIDPQATFFATYQIYCHTRNILLEDHNIDITSIVQNWRALAQNGESGPRSEFRTFMIEGMRTKVANFDCVWHIRAAVSDSNISLIKHGVQMLYYDLL